MQTAYHAANLAEAHMVCEVLRQEGVECHILGEFLPGGVGELPINADDRVTHHLPYAPWQSMADAEAWLSRVEGLLRDEWLAASQTERSAP